MTKRENQLSNLQADITLSNLPEEETHRNALKLQSDCATLQSHLYTLQQYRKILTTNALRVHERLTLHTVFTLAERESTRRKKKKELFETGFNLSCSITNAGNCPEKQITLPFLADKAEKIEAKLTHLEIPELPEPAKQIIKSHIETCKTAINHIHTFISLIKDASKKPLKKIDSINKKLQYLKQQPFSEVLPALQDLSKKALDVIYGFHFGVHLLSEIEKNRPFS